MFLVLSHIASMLACFIMRHSIRVATLNLTITYLTFNQLLLCFSKYGKLFTFIMVFLFSSYVFLHLTYCTIICILLEFFLPHNDLHILRLVYENLPASNLLLYYGRLILNQFYFTIFLSIFIERFTQIVTWFFPTSIYNRLCAFQFF